MTENTTEVDFADPDVQAARMYGSPSPPTQQPRKGGTLEDPLNEELRRRGMYPSSDAERRQREQTERRISGEEVAEGSSEDLSSADVRQRRMYAQEDAAEPEQDEETEAEPEQTQKQVEDKKDDKPAELKSDMDPEILTSYQKAAKELGLDHRQQQALLDKVVPAMRERQQAQLASMRAEWVEQARSDDHLSRERGFDHNLGVAQKALQRFGTPALTTLLAESGLGDHPEMIRLLLRVGRRLGTV